MGVRSAVAARVVACAQGLDDRRVLNGIAWKFRTGTAWREVPERYGSWATLHTRFRRWVADGTFERMLRAAQSRTDAAGDIDWLVSVDSTTVRAHQHGQAPESCTSPGASRCAPRPIWYSAGHEDLDPALSQPSSRVIVETGRCRPTRSGQVVAPQPHRLDRHPVRVPFDLLDRLTR
ncbi:transposase [Streptomyces sp. NPDC005728]|uniref:transposase n=1 Tax=Streptomyces sp. NPDC005728 TaxID=3157054 RepID=UPI0033C1A28D